MNEQEQEQLSLAIYGIVVSIRDTLSLPTHNTLMQTTIYSAVLFLCTLVSDLLGFYTFIGWPGALICTVCLGILLFIERSEQDALSRMYRSAKLSAQKAMRRAANTSTGQRSGRNSTNATQRTNATQQQSGRTANARK